MMPELAIHNSCKSELRKPKVAIKTHDGIAVPLKAEIELELTTQSRPMLRNAPQPIFGNGSNIMCHPEPPPEY